jgi:hypothetical protein
MPVSVLFGERLAVWDEASLESLRQAVMEEFGRSLPVGEEIAGVLYGRSGPTSIEIRAWRRVEGLVPGQPAVPLPDAAFANARLLVADYRADIELRDLKPVGWFRSRTRGMAALSPEDAQVCSILFDNQPCVAVILRPSTQKPVTAAFFEVEPGVTLENSRRGVSIALVPPELPTEAVRAVEVQPPPVTAPGAPSVAPPWPRWAGWALAVIPALISGTFALYFFLDRPVRLDGSTSDNGAIIRWNRFAGFLTGATGAEVMLDKDAVELDRDGLRRGEYPIRVKANQIRVRFRVRGPKSEKQNEAILILRETK